MDSSLLVRLKEELLRCDALAPEERKARISHLERTSPELARELRSLLEQTPIVEPRDTSVELFEPLLAEPPLRDSGTALRQIGPYRLLEVLGVGGMGIVYRAEQLEPLQRQVAVKLLRGGLDPARIVARFAAERRAMALLEHHAIARILDAGLDIDGMPYLVTELVRGMPITDYCRGRRLSVPEVLRLFIEVCWAVQHAHQKGIIHRDLKPSNILVAEVDGSPRPKIIDFGIARILEEETGAGSVLTVEGQAIGTLGYMSPEQAAGRSAAMDTRTDVYSLGVVLYELLSGSLPHATEGRITSEALAIIGREKPRPLTIAGRGRSRDNELETIVQKALATEPEGRYGSAGAFAEDLERYLRHEAILARPPSTVYVLRKLVRRHQAAFVMGVGLFALMAMFAVAMAVLYARQRRERERAEIETRKATATSEFLQSMLGSASPREKHVDVQVREVLDDAARRLDFGSLKDAEIEAALRRTIGNAYRELGDYNKADEQLVRAVHLRRRAFGPDHPLVAESLDDLAGLKIALGAEPRGLAAADSLGRAALVIRRRVFGEDRPEVAASLQQLAEIHRLRYQFAVAESLQVRSLAILARSKGEQSPEMIHGCGALARILTNRNRFAEAESLYRRSVAIARACHPGDHPDVAEALGALGMFEQSATRSVDVADSLAVQVLAMERRMWGPRHIRVAEALSQLGSVRIQEGRVAEAESLCAEAFRIEIQVYGEGTTGAAEAYSALSRAEYVGGEYDEAKNSLRTAISIWKSLHAETSGLGRALDRLGSVLSDGGSVDEATHEALALRLEALAVLEHVWGPRHTDVAQCDRNIAGTLMRLDRPAEAEPYLRRAIAIWSDLYGENDPHAAMELGSLGYMLYRMDRLPEAEVQYRKSLAVFAASATGDTWQLSRLLNLTDLGMCVYSEGRLEEAEALLRHADREYKRSVGMRHPKYPLMLQMLGSVLLDRGKLHEADSVLALSLRLRNALPRHSRDDGWIRWTQNALGASAARQGRPAAADSLFRLSEARASEFPPLPSPARRIARQRYERYRSR